MITVADLINEFGDSQFSTITEGNDFVGLRCIEKARIWIVTRFDFCGRDSSSINWDDSIIREAHLKRACYELWSYGEMEDVANDKRSDALEILAGVLGNCVYGSVDKESKNTKHVSACVVKGGQSKSTCQPVSSPTKEKTYIWNENHSSEVDGIKNVFPCNYFYVSNYTKVKCNGQELILGVDYFERNNINIELTFVPDIGDVLIFDYLRV